MIFEHLGLQLSVTPYKSHNYTTNKYLHSCKQTDLCHSATLGMESDMGNWKIHGTLVICLCSVAVVCSGHHIYLWF